MKLRVLGAEALRQSLTMTDTIEAMKGAFAAYSSGAATVPQRIALPIPPDDGVLLIKPALRNGPSSSCDNEAIIFLIQPGFANGIIPSRINTSARADRKSVQSID